MAIKEVISGSSSEQESRRFWAICQTVGFAMMASAIIDPTNSIFGATYTYDGVLDLGYVVVLVGLVMAVISMTSKPLPPKALDHGLVLVIVLLMVNFVWAIIFEFRFGGYETVSVPACGFLLVVLSVPASLGRVLTAREPDKRSGQPVVNSAEMIQQRPTATSVDPDMALYFSVGGAAAVALSLLALPWFALESFDWNDAMNITFNDLRSVYNFAKDEGLDLGVRFFYLEWGYIVSYASAVTSPLLAMRLREKKPMLSATVLNMGIGLTGLVGIWVAVLAAGLSEIDDEGSVQIGMWLGVGGHIALIVALVLIRRAVVTSTRGSAVGA